MAVALSADGKSAYVADLVIGRISQYTVAPDGTLSPKMPASVAAFPGPEAIALSADGKSAYVPTNGDNTVSQYTVAANGTLSPKTPATVAAGAGPVAIALSADGKSAYVTNVNVNTVSQYTIAANGTLSPKSPATVATGSRPSSIGLNSDGKSAYVINALDDTVSQYTVAANGTLSPKTPATVATLSGPAAIVLSAGSKAATVTGVSGAPNPSVFGQAVTLTATVSPNDGGGTVAFTDGGTLISGCGARPVASTTPHQATCTTSALGVGAHSIVATFSGDANYLGSTSAATGQRVNRAATVTGVSGGPNPSVFGQAVTLTATVSPNDGGGTVAFTDGGTLISGCGARPVASTTPHRATCTTSALGVGAHSIVATYTGDANYLGSTSTATGQQVNRAATSTAVSVSPAGPQAFGQPVTFTATVVARSPGAGTPTGTVVFAVDGARVGSAVLAGGSASITTASLRGGPHTVTATYGGDGNFTGSTGTARPTVACAATITGSHPGALIVRSSTCVSDAEIGGAIIVKPGGSLDVEHSTISGPVDASGTPGAIRICDSHISGALDVRDASGLVIIGDPLIGCAPNVIGGALIVKNNTHGVEVINNTVGGAIDITSNSGPGPYPGQNTTTTGNHH